MKPTAKKSKLVQAIESGKQIKGLVGYVETDVKRADNEDEVNVLIKVRCLGYSIADSNHSGGSDVRIKAVPIAGVGEMDIDASRWYDTDKYFIAIREYESRCEAAGNDVTKIMRYRLLTQVKRCAIEYITEYFPDGETELRAEAAEMYNVTENTKTENLLKLFSKSEVSQLLSAFAAHYYQVDEEDISINHYRW